MKDQNIPLNKKLAKLFLSFFGTGYSPFAPGTVGSLATIPLLYALSFTSNILYTIMFTLILFIPACIITERIQKEEGLHDPGWIVIDEVIGMLVTWCFIFPSRDPLTLLAVFICFRFFDIIKFWPASHFDKKVTHGFGTIFDDVLSALYAGGVIWVLNYFHLIK